MTRGRAVGALLVLCGALLAGVMNTAPAGRVAPPRHVPPPRPGDPASAAISRGIEWLRRQQSPDGGWHSETYGSIRCGAGNTALIVDALSQLPDSHRQTCGDLLERASAFLIRHLATSGCVQGTDGETDFPVYATALTLSALQRAGPDQYPEEMARMATFLSQAQQVLLPAERASETDFGGWSPTGGVDSVPLLTGRTNLSTTCHTLEALAAIGALTDKCREAALRFIGSCQRLDAGSDDAGGFAFSPHGGDLLNKAGFGPTGTARPYGTATADGIRALLACGIPPSDSRVEAAHAWLHAHAESDRVPGFASDEAEGWSRALWYYYAASFSRVAAEVSSPTRDARRRILSGAIIARQSADGSWQNPVSLMREDDPLIATPLALIALSARSATSIRR